MRFTNSQLHSGRLQPANAGYGATNGQFYANVPAPAPAPVWERPFREGERQLAHPGQESLMILKIKILR